MISEVNIQQIKEDIRNAGIDYSPLQQELIDHICSDIECKITSGESFKDAYRKIRSLYINDANLSMLQDDTKNLLDYKSLLLKKLLILTSGITFLGLLLKKFRISGGNTIQFLSLFFLSFLIFKLGSYFFKDKRASGRKKVISFSFYATSISLVIAYLFYCFIPDTHTIATLLNMFSYLLLAFSMTFYFSIKTEINIYGVLEITRKADLVVSYLNLVLAINSIVFYMLNFSRGLVYILFIIIGANLVVLIYHLSCKTRFKSRLISILIVSTIIIHVYHLLHILN